MSLLTDTGFGSCLVLIVGFVGIPLAYYFDNRRSKQ